MNTIQISALTTRTIGEICDESGGDVQTGPFGSQLHASDYVSAGVPVVMPVNIIDGRISNDGIARIALKDHQRLEKYHLHTGDIVYARRGDIGRCALVTENEHGWLCGTGCLRIRFNNPLVDNRVVAYYLGLPSSRDVVFSMAVGTTMPNLNTTILRGVPIHLPPLHVQHRIANIIGSLDDKIELNRQMNESLEQLAMALYKHWFVDFGPFQDGEFVESELGMIPAGCEVVRLSDYCDRITDGSHWSPQEEQLGDKRIATVKNMGKYSLDLESCKIISDDDYNRLIGEGCRPSRGDVLFSKDGTIGRIHFVALEEDVVLLSSIAIFRAKREFSPSYLWAYLSNPATLQMIRDGYVTGSALPRVVLKDFKRAPVLLPPDGILRSFEDKIAPLLNLITANEEEGKQLRRTRNYLLPRLLSGEIELGEAEEQVEEVRTHG